MHAGIMLDDSDSTIIQQSPDIAVKTLSILTAYLPRPTED